MKYIVILISLAVLLSSCSTLAGQASRSKTISANSCDRDGVCETKKVLVESTESNIGAQVVLRTYQSGLGQDRVVFEDKDGKVAGEVAMFPNADENPRLHILNAKDNGYIVFGLAGLDLMKLTNKGVSVNGRLGIGTEVPLAELHVGGKAIIRDGIGTGSLTVGNGASIRGTVTLEYLEGDGNAYVCVTSDGVLFRSASPCT